MKKLIVIGGGFAGSTISRKLESKFDLTLIDSKEYFEFTPGVLRTIVEPEHIKKIQRFHRHYLKKAKVVVGHVTEISKDFVMVNGKKLNYDYLVIASGSSYNVPFKEADIVSVARASELREYYQHLCKSKKVLIIGGGLVGVELAAEICTHYNDKEIQIVHAMDRLIERNHINAVKHAEKFLLKRGVKIYYNEKIIEFNKKYKSDKGREYKADIAFLCTGIKPNYDFMKKVFSKKLNNKGFIKVNEYLQVEGEKKIFAVGDISDRIEEKTAQNAERQAKFVIENILALENKKELKKYFSKKTPLVISLGKWNGIYSQGKFVFTGIIPGLMKTMIEWKEMLKIR